MVASPLAGQGGGAHQSLRQLPGPARGGLLGLILCRHIDKIHELTGSYDHIAIGSDRYIKPALPGLEHQGRMADLHQALHERYGAAVAAQIARDNALRVLRTQWGRKRPRP